MLRWILPSLIVAGWLAMVPHTARAMDGALSTQDHAWNEAQRCHARMPRYERKLGIPQYLLESLALTESGRLHRGSGSRLAWPWTVQANGKGRFFASKAEAIAEVRRLQQQGVSSIDVGCMQINLHYHGAIFDSLEQAFDPDYNIAYAAYYLRRHFRSLGSWRKAVARYHSGTPWRGRDYADKVLGNWKSIMTTSIDSQHGTAGASQVASASPYTAPRQHRAAPPLHEVKEQVLALSDVKRRRVQQRRDGDLLFLAQAQPVHAAEMEGAAVMPVGRGDEYHGKTEPLRRDEQIVDAATPRTDAPKMPAKAAVPVREAAAEKNMDDVLARLDAAQRGEAMADAKASPSAGRVEMAANGDVVERRDATTAAGSQQPVFPQGANAIVRGGGPVMGQAVTRYSGVYADLPPEAKEFGAVENGVWMVFGQ